MTGTYTEVTITAPSSAQAGATVDVVVAVRNILDYTIYVIPVLNIDGNIIEGGYMTITPGETDSWALNFTMPTSDVVLTVDSWCESYYFEWQLDYSVQHTVAVIGAGIGIDLSSMMGLMIVVMMMSMMAKMMKGV